MMNKMYEKCRRRLVKEGVVKALFLSVAIGCAAMGVTAFFSWYFGFKAGLYIAIGILAACVGGFTPLFYFLRYRPTVKQVARRVDALGLEERVITMTELEGEDSFMAAQQRRDTENSLGKVNHMLLKIAVSVGAIVALAICGTLGLGTFTVDALHNAGVIPSGKQIATEIAEDKTYHVSYLVDGKGYVIEYTESLTETLVPESIEVKGGEDAPAVLAVPGSVQDPITMELTLYVFVEWSDGLKTPYRHDVNVSGNLTVWAVFAPMDDIDQNDPSFGDGSGPSNPGDETAPEEDDGPNDPGDGQGDGSESAGGFNNSASQQVYDGETYYGDEFDEAFDEALDRLESDDNLTDEQKSWVADYYESIQRNKNNGN